MTENIGKNGRLYFTYGKGAAFELYGRESDDPISSITIVDCGLSPEEVESYSFVIRSADGKVSREAIEPLERLEELLNAGAAEQTEAGDAVEVPLTVKEVKWFYSAQRTRRKKGIEQANKILSESEPTKKSEGKKNKKDKPPEGEEYSQLLKEQEMLEKYIALAIVAGEEIPAVLSEKYRALCERRKEYIEAKNVPFLLFYPEEICPVCKNTGLAEGSICECARKKSAEIKKFCAMQRVKRRLSDEWAVLSPREEQTDEEGGEDEQKAND